MPRVIHYKQIKRPLTPCPLALLGSAEEAEGVRPGERRGNQRQSVANLVPYAACEFLPPPPPRRGMGQGVIIYTIGTKSIQNFGDSRTPPATL